MKLFRPTKWIFAALSLSLCLYGCGGSDKGGADGDGTANQRIEISGVLRYIAPDSGHIEAWLGHTYLVSSTPVIPGSNVTEDVLHHYLNRHVVVSGVWDPGEEWFPQPDELPRGYRYDPDEPEIRFDGLILHSIE